MENELNLGKVQLEGPDSAGPNSTDWKSSGKDCTNFRKWSEGRYKRIVAILTASFAFPPAMGWPWCSSAIKAEPGGIDGYRGTGVARNVHCERKWNR